MTDPLRPLVGLVEAAARSSNITNAKVAEQKSTVPVNANTQSAHGAANAQESLALKLRSRLAGVDRNDRKQLRQAFIEVSLLCELGEQLIIDPGFAALVEQVDVVMSADTHATEALERALLPFLTP